MKKNIFLMIGALLLTAVSGCLPLEWNDGVLIDVRSPQEFQEGALKGAINIPHTMIGEKIEAVVPDKSTPIFLYCRSGRRVESAMKVLKAKKYTALCNLGGIEEARQELRLPVVKAPAGKR